MDKELELYGLAFGSPNERRIGCSPFKEIHHLSFIDKVAWVECLGEDEIREMIAQQKDC